MSRETDLAWAAGIIDGEGCIRLHHAHTQTGEAYVLQVCVVNTSLRMVERLKEIFGVGHIFPRPKPKSIKHRPQWEYGAAAKKAEIILKLVEPYLVNKREEAHVGLRSRQLIRTLGANTLNPNKAELNWLRVRLSELKHG